ncbi:MAG TPA: ATPase, T2SS/T4P/T4SS family, partial [Gemmatimonadales bacterium]|nr:ATPase, T2SS/T4P/T4SS family [Gemmatimonadales bacterium]
TRIASADRGLVIIAGVSGSGRSSTVAAMVHHINRTQQKHIVTIENPIEFLHRDLNCSVTQREVGVDTESLAVGVRAALRQDPDVVVMGDMADAETVDTAIKAAETGRLVIATMPTPDATTTVERLIATLSRDEREVGRMRFSEAVRAVVAQQLLPRPGEQGRVAAVEVLIATPAIRSCLKAADRMGELKRLVADGKDQGMQTFEEHLSELVAEERISAETARGALIPTPRPVSGSKRGSRQAGGG